VALALAISVILTYEPMARARLALEGLSVGDAFGEQLLHAGRFARAIASISDELRQALDLDR